MAEQPFHDKYWSGKFLKNDEFVGSQAFFHTPYEQNPFNEPAANGFFPPQEDTIYEKSSPLFHQPQSGALTRPLFLQEQYTIPDHQPPSISPKTPVTPAVHKTTGHRAKKYKCTYSSCDQTFTCPHNREQHIREKHTFQRPNVCHVCAAQGYDKAFTRPFTLYRHLREVHKLHVPIGKGHRRRGTAGHVDLDDTMSKQKRMSRNKTRAPPRTTSYNGLPAMDAVQYWNGNGRFQQRGPQHHNLDLNACSICNAFVATTLDEIVVHQHAVHGVPHSEYCLCPWCLESHPFASTGEMEKQAEDAKFEIDMRMQLETYLTREIRKIDGQVCWK